MFRIGKDRVHHVENEEGFGFGTAEKDCAAFSYCGADIGKGIGGFEE